ncbi:MAG: DNA polymerase III subunit beta [Armatimonadota bacterium]|nr:DNA polymerase III subunit beta [Armatimonadota bacterium]
MRVICSRKGLQEGVQTVARAVSPRTSLPILGHILMKTEDDRLRLVAYDLEIGLEHTVEASVQEPGALTIPARVVNEIISTLPDADVELSTDTESTVNLKCGTSQFSILGLPPEEFPMLPEVTKEVRFKIDSEVLREGISKTIFAVSTDESRVILTGMLLQVSPEQLKLVSTDTHRLCVFDCPISECEGSVNAIVPARAMQEATRIAGEGGEVDVVISPTQIKFTCGQTVLVSRLIEGQFPNFEKVIPTEYSRKLIIPTEQFAQAMRRVEIVARESSQRTKFTITDGTLTLTAEAPNIGRAHEEVEVIKEGEDIRLAFNAKYILDVLSVSDTEAIEMELSGEVSPALIRPQGKEDYLYVLMPMHMD